jgi:hypothetical protein
MLRAPQRHLNAAVIRSERINLAKQVMIVLATITASCLAAAFVVKALANAAATAIQVGF